MYGYEDHVSVLIYEFYHLLEAAHIILYPHQSTEYSYAVIYVHYVITYVKGCQIVYRELFTLFDRTAKQGPVKTLKYLVIGIAAYLVLTVYESLMYVFPYNEFRQRTEFFLQNADYSVSLGLLFTEDLYFVALFKPASDIGAEKFEVLVEYRLRLNVKEQGSCVFRFT